MIALHGKVLNPLKITKKIEELALVGFIKLKCLFTSKDSETRIVFYLTKILQKIKS